MTPDGGKGWERLSGIVAQYEVLRSAALGHVLPPEARSGLLLFLRCGMWGVDTGDGHDWRDPAAAGETWSIVELPSR